MSSLGLAEKTGTGRDRSRKASKSDLGDREHTEVVWLVDRSARAVGVSVFGPNGTMRGARPVCLGGEP